MFRMALVFVGSLTAPHRTALRARSTIACWTNRTCPTSAMPIRRMKNIVPTNASSTITLPRLARGHSQEPPDFLFAPDICDYLSGGGPYSLVRERHPWFTSERMMAEKGADGISRD